MIYEKSLSGFDAVLGIIAAILLAFIFTVGVSLVWVWLVLIPCIHILFHVTLPYWATVGLWASACLLFACSRSTAGK